MLLRIQTRPQRAHGNAGNQSDHYDDSNPNAGAVPDIQERGDILSPVSEAKKKANAKYNEKAYDRINIVVPKGRKAELQEHAQQRGESLNGFVNRAIDHEVERDRQQEGETNG